MSDRHYPDHYRQKECENILRALQAGDCAAVIGLSGAGKSNLIRFLSQKAVAMQWVTVDCNRLRAINNESFLRLLSAMLGGDGQVGVDLSDVEALLADKCASGKKLCILLDRFDLIKGAENHMIHNNMRVLRDTFKYQLTYLIAMRKPLSLENELSELFFANTIWLGSLSPEDARWSIRDYFSRYQLTLSESEVLKIAEMSGRYPAFLRAVCEAYRAGVPLKLAALTESTPVQARLREFWLDEPEYEVLEKVGLAQNPLLSVMKPLQVDETNLTAKEKALWTALKDGAGTVMEKDALISAVWPEDVIFERGIRDDSLAQLVRRLREKVEADPSNPRYIITVPGRGYMLELEN